MRIAAPEPIGLRTAETESLSGYVQRLAALHDSSPGQLMHRVFSHAIAGDDRFVGRWRKSRSIFLPDNINGFSHAVSWLRVLHFLVRRADLDHLTIKNWDSVFPVRHVLAPSLKWCPQCLLEDPIPYHRLLWGLAPTAACTKHRCLLTDCCPSCGHSVWVLHDRSRTTRCPLCGQDLRRTSNEPPILPSDDIRLSEADELARFLPVASSIGSIPRRLSGGRLRDWARIAGIRTPAALGVLTRVPKTTAWYWWRGAASPSLPATLRISLAFRIPLASLIFKPVGRNPKEKASYPVQVPLPLRPYRTSRRHDWPSIQIRLEAELRRPLMEARSVTSVSIEIGVDRRTVREHKPDLCRRISARYLRRQHLIAKRNNAALRRRLRAVVKDLSRVGMVISQRNIAAHMGHHGLFSRSKARRALAETLARHAVDWPKAVTFPRAI